MIFKREQQLKHWAREQYMHHHRRAMLQKWWSCLIGGRRQLVDIETMRCLIPLSAQSDAGLQIVAIDEIVGSEGRSSEFDRDWRPLTPSSRERWVRIAAAHLDGIGLPAVDLIRIGRHHFVRDGHHRISVAKTYGQEEIEANVIDWQVPSMGTTAIESKPRSLDRQQMNKESTMLYDINVIRQIDYDRRMELRRSYENGSADSAWLKGSTGQAFAWLGDQFLGLGRRLQKAAGAEKVFGQEFPGSRTGAGA